MRIAVAGTGYVGLSLATLLAQHHDVVAVDVVQEKVNLINSRRSPIADAEIEEAFATQELSLCATTDPSAYRDAEIVIVATPTSYDSDLNFFDTTHVEEVIDLVLQMNPNALVVIKSTIPVGYTQGIYDAHEGLRVVFSPEFLREGHALYDNLHPSRIIVGAPQEREGAEDLIPAANAFAQLLAEDALEDDVTVLTMHSTEAEAVKLFANTYLALRVAYFNELDTFAEMRGLDTKQIIQGVSLDPRIGGHYNNPSFGYGGYCLPKDSKQLLANYQNVPQNLITAAVEANRTRKDFISNEVAELVRSRENKVVGIYRITMKHGSDNFRSSSILGVMQRLDKRDIKLVVYEPILQQSEFCGHEVISDLAEFKRRCGVILANRWNNELEDVGDRVYTRDLFIRD